MKRVFFFVAWQYILYSIRYTGNSYGRIRMIKRKWESRDYTGRTRQQE
jgi:hypothetical protein